MILENTLLRTGLMKSESKSGRPRIAIVGGCGHVGLPLGVTFALKGCRVDLVDISEKSVAAVNSGKFPFMEVGGEKCLKEVLNKQLFCHAKPSPVRDADVVVFVTGTPVDEHLNPRVQDVLKIVDGYLPYIRNGQLIVLRSTIYPGLTELLGKHLVTKGKSVELAFCPERVAQGFAIEEIQNLPQIVSGFTPEGERRAAELFALLTPEILKLRPIEAELTKLFANSWRYIEFAIANQHYMISEAVGADFQRIFHALTYQYPRAKSFARAGLAAGPCLFKDTMQLSAFYQSNYFLGHAAMLVNEGLPNFLVGQMEKKLKTLSGRKIGLLGMAFKPNSDDTRESLSYKLRKVLEIHGAEVLDTDVYQPTADKLEWILQTADGFILGVPHNEYLTLDLRNKPFVDCWGAWKNQLPESNSARTENAPKKRAA